MSGYDKNTVAIRLTDPPEIVNLRDVESIRVFGSGLIRVAFGNDTHVRIFPESRLVYLTQDVTE